MTDDHSRRDEREERVNRIIAQYLEAERRGESPERAELLRRHSELAEELRSFFADRDQFQRLAEIGRAHV